MNIKEIRKVSEMLVDCLIEAPTATHKNNQRAHLINIVTEEIILENFINNNKLVDEYCEFRKQEDIK